MQVRILLPLLIAAPLALAQDRTGNYVSNTDPFADVLRTQEYLKSKRNKADRRPEVQAQYDKAARMEDSGAKPADFLPLYQDAAGRGHAGAQLRLGQLHLEGKLMAQDYPQALQWFQKAAQQDVAEASFDEGYMLAEGLGTPQDRAAAAQAYRKAAQAGHMKAQFNLALVLADPVQAYAWFNIAIQNGAPEETARPHLKALEARMTPAQLAQAREMAGTGRVQ